MRKSEKFLLRLAKLREAGAIAFMSRDLVEYGLPWRWTAERIAASIRASETNVLVALNGETIAGFAIMRYGESDAHLDLLAVAPRYRRMGVGRQLVHWLERCAVVAGIFDITLELRAENELARDFYISLGYRPLHQVPGYYQGREAALRMQRDLRQGSGHGIHQRR